METQARAYQHFVDVKLMPDLKRVTDYQEKIRGEIAEYEALAETIDAISQSAAVNGTALLEIEANVYGNVKLEDPKKVIVDVGKEVYVEMSTTEALRFCHEKVYFLQRKLDSLQDDQVEIKVHTDMILFNLGELLNVY